MHSPGAKLGPGILAAGRGLKRNAVSSPLKLEAIKPWPTPKDAGDVGSGLGIVGHYTKFVTYYSKKACPLSWLTEKSVDFVWGKEEEEASYR